MFIVSLFFFFNTVFVANLRSMKVKEVKCERTTSDGGSASCGEKIQECVVCYYKLFRNCISRTWGFQDENCHGVQKLCKAKEHVFLLWQCCDTFLLFIPWTIDIRKTFESTFFRFSQTKGRRFCLLVLITLRHHPVVLIDQSAWPSTWRTVEHWWNRRVIFLFPSSCASRSCRASSEILRSPCLAHRAPVVKASLLLNRRTAARKLFDLYRESVDGDIVCASVPQYIVDSDQWKRA